MNVQNILHEIAQQDPEVYERISPRRNVIRNLGRVAAMSAIPFALGAMLKKAYGKPTDVITDTLQFALTLEYLEAEFYATGINAAGLPIPAADRPSIQLIADHEADHVQFLKDTLAALGQAPGPKPNFDFTAGNVFTDVFTGYPTFLAVAQTFEDTGVRAYKGQAGNLMGNNDVLEAALRIHSVEARHASKIRQLRKANGHSTTVKPWITQNQSGINTTAVQASYDGEDQTMQAGLQIAGIGGQTISSNAATEAFDEPLTKDQILAIVDPFILPRKFRIADFRFRIELIEKMVA